MSSHREEATNALQDGGEPRTRTYRVPFPDDESPRRVRFARLPRNALPPPEASRSPRQLSVKAVANNEQREVSYPSAFSPVSTAVQSIRRQQKKATHRTPSPATADARAAKLRGLVATYLPKTRLSVLDQWIAARPPHRSDADDAESTAPATLTRSQDDYDLYLYLASKYGALDGVLYCCTPCPGQTYRWLVSTSARRLQRWSRRRMVALRRFWVVSLARATAASALDAGLADFSRSYQHQQVAMANVQRVRRLRANQLLRRWRHYAGQMGEVRRRFAAAVNRAVVARFQRWRDRTAAVKQFKRQLKTVARRKAMTNAMDQWQQWKQRHEKLRVHLTRRWMKTQRECLTAWRLFARESRACRRIQRPWRLQRWRRARVKAGALIVAVMRGSMARRRVRELRTRVEIGSVVFSLVEKLVRVSYHEEAVKMRAKLLATEVARVDREKQVVREAEQEAEARVDRELGAIVRNVMHQRLHTAMQSVREDHYAEGNPKALKGLDGLRSLARQQLVDEEQMEARADAVAAFRSADAANHPLERCLVCVAQEELASAAPCCRLFGHECVPSEWIGEDPEGIREYLKRLEAEGAYVEAIDSLDGVEAGQLDAYIDAR